MPTLPELCAAHLADVLTRHKYSESSSYVAHCRYFSALWWDRTAASITRQEVEAWANARKEQRSPATVRHEIAFLKRAYNLGIDAGQVEKNPVCRIKCPLKPTSRHQWLDPASEVKMRRAYSQTIGEDGDLLWCVERFAILTGLRQGEQAHLKPEHLQGDYLEVPAEGKTGKRTIPLHPEARAIAELWCEVSAEKGSPYVFWPDKKRGRAQAATYHSRHVWAPARAVAGLKFQRRDLRRTFGSRLVQKGVPIYEVQLLLGHATTKQTETYCKVELGQLRASVLLL